MIVGRAGLRLDRTRFEPFAISGFALAQLTPAGQLDPSLGTGGKVTSEIPGMGWSQGLDAAFDASGRIVAVGEARPTPYTSPTAFALARYLPSGQPDPSFGTGGYVVTLFGAGDDNGAGAVALAADGRIVAAGYSRAGFAAARYGDDGSLDPTFDGDGTATYPLGGRVNDVAVAADGRVVMAGDSRARVAVLRVNADGSRDGTFADAGAFIAPSPPGPIGGGAFYGAVVDPTGTPTVAGHSRGQFMVVRFTPDGQLDPPSAAATASPRHPSSSSLPVRPPTPPPRPLSFRTTARSSLAADFNPLSASSRGSFS